MEDSSWVAANHSVRRHVLCHEASGAHYRSIANPNPAQNYGSLANPNVIANDDVTPGRDPGCGTLCAGDQIRKREGAHPLCMVLTIDEDRDAARYGAESTYSER